MYMYIHVAVPILDHSKYISLHTFIALEMHSVLKLGHSIVHVRIASSPGSNIAQKNPGEPGRQSHMTYVINFERGWMWTNMGKAQVLMEVIKQTLCIIYFTQS